ncbi:MAG: hypothetical protein LUF90_06230 [Rikenellaceae bacterium]|nr:hypothetical protein [Rikenellaceae bacterium]
MRDYNGEPGYYITFQGFHPLTLVAEPVRIERLTIASDKGSFIITGDPNYTSNIYPVYYAQELNQTFDGPLVNGSFEIAGIIEPEFFQYDEWLLVEDFVATVTDTATGQAVSISAVAENPEIHYTYTYEYVCSTSPERVELHVNSLRLYYNLTIVNGAPSISVELTPYHTNGVLNIQNGDTPDYILTDYAIIEGSNGTNLFHITGLHGQIIYNKNPEAYNYAERKDLDQIEVINGNVPFYQTQTLLSMFTNNVSWIKFSEVSMAFVGWDLIEVLLTPENRSQYVRIRDEVYYVSLKTSVLNL